MFTEDTTITTCHKQTEPLADFLQESADELQPRMELNHMALKSLQTRVMPLTTRQKRQNFTSPFPKIHPGIQQVSEVQLFFTTLFLNFTCHGLPSSAGQGLSNWYLQPS